MFAFTVLQRRAPLMAAALLAAMLAGASGAQAKVRVITTTPTFADIVARVGGERVQVEALMRGREDVHNVPPKPSFVIKLRRADLFVHGGLDGEPWVPQLLRTARNRSLLIGQPGNVDASQGVPLKEVPARSGLSRAQGDIHVFGNTHYMLDPLNGVIVAHTIADALKRQDPGHAADFDANLAKFETDVQELVERLSSRMAPYTGTPVVVYHRSWPYFRDRFGLVKVGEVEPKPGISPGPRHLSDLVETMKQQSVRVVIVEQYNPANVAENVANRAGGVAVVLATDVHGVEGADDYLSLFETNVNRLIAAFERAGVSPSAQGVNAP